MERVSMDLAKAETAVLAWHERMPEDSGEAALWLLGQVQILTQEVGRLEEADKARTKYNVLLERRVDDEIKGLRESIEKTRRNRPRSDSVVMNEHALMVLARVREGYGYEVWSPMGV